MATRLDGTMLQVWEGGGEEMEDNLVAPVGQLPDDRSLPSRPARCSPAGPHFASVGLLGSPRDCCLTSQIEFLNILTLARFSSQLVGPDLVIEC